MATPAKNFITTEKAGKLCKCTPSRITALIRSKEVTAKKVGGKWLVSKKSLERLLKKRKPKGKKSGKQRTAVRRSTKKHHTRVSSHKRANHKRSPPVVAGISEVSTAAPAEVLEIVEVIAAPRPQLRYAPIPVNAPVFVPARTTTFQGIELYPLRANILALSVAFLALFSGMVIARTGFMSQLAIDTGQVIQQASANVSSALAYVASRAAVSAPAAIALAPSSLAPAPVSTTPVFNGVSGFVADTGSSIQSVTRMAMAPVRQIPLVQANDYAQVAETPVPPLTALSNFITKMNLWIGSSIIAATHASIHADVSLVYWMAHTAPESARAVTLAFVSTGDTLMRATARLPRQTTSAFLAVTALPAHIAPALAQAVIGGETVAAERFLAVTTSITDEYVALIKRTGEATYTVASAAYALNDSVLRPVLATSLAPFAQAYGEAAVAATSLSGGVSQSAAAFFCGTK